MFQDLRRAWLVALCFLGVSISRPAIAAIPVGDGTNYYYPNPTITGANQYSWLMSANYTNRNLPSGGESFPGCRFHRSPQELLADDIAFIKANRLGNFQRVWISLDQLFSSWDVKTGFNPNGNGYDSRALTNVDDALHQFARSGIKVDIVLFCVGEKGAVKAFHFECLDGFHPQMQANYIAAVRQFLRHIAADSLDCAAVPVVDLECEAYYQDSFWLSSHKNKYGNSKGYNVLHSRYFKDAITPFLTKLYHAARSVTRKFLYTCSAGDLNLLNTSPAEQKAWESIYPVDVYDIHCYLNDPWNYASKFRSGLALNKPWFTGETGCSPGNVDCTYDGSHNATDRWWLNNLPADGCQAVLLEEADTTAWTVAYDSARCTYAYPYALQPAGVDIAAHCGNFLPIGSSTRHPADLTPARQER